MLRADAGLFMRHEQAGEIDDSRLAVKNATCGSSNGSITGLTGSVSQVYKWTDAGGKQVGTALDLTNVPGSKYTLTYTNTVTNVAKTYGPVEVKDLGAPIIDATNLKVTGSSCGENTGSITGLKITGTGKLAIIWTCDYSPTISYFTADLINVPPGVYKLSVLDDAKCAFATARIVVPGADVNQIMLDATKVVIKNYNCGGLSNGSITGLSVKNPSPKQKFAWTDGDGTLWSQSLDVTNIPQGYYTLKMMYDNQSCPQTYGPIKIVNEGGPTIYEDRISTVGADCNNENGQILLHKTPTGTGILKYEWLNTSGGVISTEKDLKGVSSGVYQLRVSDDSYCGVTLSKKYYVSQIDGLRGGAPNMLITKASCSNYGSVIGWEWDGSTNYFWTDEAGNVISRDLYLINAPGGIVKFNLISPCLEPNGQHYQTTQTFDLGPKILPAPTLNVDITFTCMNVKDGAIKITNSTQSTITKYRWANAAGVTVGTGPQISGLEYGNYSLYLTDIQGCERLYETYLVVGLVVPELVTDTIKITKDRCSAGVGSITGVGVRGRKPPFKFQWTDANNKVVATTAKASGLVAGDYYLTVSDAGSCGSIPLKFTIGDTQEDLPAPILTDIKLCDGGNAFLAVKNVNKSYKYNIYETAQSLTPVDTRADGRFNMNVTTDRSYFVSAALGICESARTEVKIQLGINKLTIPNIITPNGDGINDSWKVVNIEKYPDAQVNIYTRNGQLAYHSVGYTVPFNGTYNGKLLPSGTYYYMIDIKRQCAPIGGNLTIIR